MYPREDAGWYNARGKCANRTRGRMSPAVSRRNSYMVGTRQWLSHPVRLQLGFCRFPHGKVNIDWLLCARCKEVASICHAPEQRPQAPLFILSRCLGEPSTTYAPLRQHSHGGRRRARPRAHEESCSERWERPLQTLGSLDRSHHHGGSMPAALVL